MPEPTLSVTIDGHPYSIRPREIDAWQAATFQAETGLSVEGLLRLLESDDENDQTLVVLAQFCYLAELVVDPAASFRDVAARISYGSEIAKMAVEGFDDDEIDDDDAEVVLDDEVAPVDPTSGPDGSTGGELGSSLTAGPSSETT